MPGLNQLLNDPTGANVFRQQLLDANLLDPMESPGARATLQGFQDQSQQFLSENVLPQIASRASLYGAAGDTNTALQNAQAIQRVNRDLSGMTGQFLSNLYGQGLGTASQQAGQLDALRSNALSNQTQRRGIATQRAIAELQNQTALKQLGLQRELGLGEQERLNALAALQGDQFLANLMMQQEMAPFQQLGLLSNLILPIAGGFGATQTTGTNVQPGLNTNPFAAFLTGGIGGALTGLGAFNAFGGGSGLDPAARRF